MKNNRIDAFNRDVKTAVGALAAWPARKRTMEEELSAHFCAAFAEELERTGDQNAAADAATKRLGGLTALVQELAATVPWWERAACLCLGLKENKMARILWLLGVLAILFGTALMLPAMAHYRDHGNWGEVWPMVDGTSMTIVGVGIVIWGIARRMRRTTKVAQS